MKLNIRKLIATSLLVVAPMLLPVAAYAQSTAPAPTTNNQQITNLPNDIQNQEAQQQQQAATTTTTSSTANNTPLTQTEQFLVGVGVGVVLGIIIGGVVVWFTKK